jgi:glutamine synthetase
MSNFKSICEYIWIGGKGELRSKTRVFNHLINCNDIPEWNYDGSSTGQAPSDGNTEGILKPVAYYKNPLRKINGYNNLLVLCETYDNNGNPLETNHRHEAKKIFDSKLEEEPWYGLEQEYFINIKNNLKPIANIFSHYCGATDNPIERQIVEKHLLVCLEAELTISGINAEVASQQWEFQVGPCEGIKAGDDLIVARYLLERVAEDFDATILFEPKPVRTANGSGCHTNFSTKVMREENGIEEIYKAIDKLETNHEEHIKVYGKNNEMRLTGLHETASYKEFSWGKGTRNTSVRIPNHVIKDGQGYFEDRRPAANMDPYLVTSMIFKTCCIPLGKVSTK